MDPKFVKYIMAGIALMIAVPAASAITIDGNPDEWGPAGFLTGDWNLNGTWLPKPGVNFIVENNRNPNYPQAGFAGSPYTGVHIKGVGSSFTFYDEPKVQLEGGSWVVEPYGYELYDLEALYYQEDATNVYILVVTAVPPDGIAGEAPGDLRININKTKNADDGTPYEMGVKLGSATGFTQFGLYNVKSWKKEPYLIPENWPATISQVNGPKITTVTGVYKKCDVGCNLGTNADTDLKGESRSQYIIELAIPKSDLVSAEDVDKISADDFSISDNCTNDQIKIPIPEFATIALPIAAILGLVFVLRMRRKEH